MEVSRQEVYDKYNGKCAYCGEDINLKKFQVDHIHPRHLSHLENLDNDRYENLNPACRKCNSFKAGSVLEIFRSELSLQVERLLRNNTWAARQFDRALRFKQVEITKRPIVFHFEERSTK
jgi:5-methylcytosine-specific restriction endonuclease McrA